MAARISPRLRRVLDIARSQSALQRLRELANREDRLWADYKREWNIPDDVTPEAGGWF